MPYLSDPDNIATSPDGKEPSSPSEDNNDEEVEVLGVVVSPADALTPAFKSGTQDLLFTPAVETEVTNVFAFFNPQASKKPRCNTLRDCFNITPNELGGGLIVTCKNCTKFGVRKWKAFNATYAREHTLQCQSFMPQSRHTIYNKYVVPIDMATTTELVRYFGILPGMVTVSFDGVTVNRKSKVRQSSTP